ncbi:MAG: PA14 domain-containing protein [Actinomycetota bacterium]
MRHQSGTFPGLLTGAVAAALAIGLIVPAGSPGQRTAEAGPIALAQVDAGGIPCTPETNGGANYVRCVLPTNATEVDLTTLPFIANDVPFWVQAWGGQGGESGGVDPDSAANGAGGAAGFAQTVMSLSDYESRFDRTTLHYLIGDRGTAFQWDEDASASGGGGAATVVTAVPASDTPFVIELDVVAIAGGGGGGAVACPTYAQQPCPSAAGGAGGIAMANSDQQRAAQPGANGGAPGRSGTGGTGGGGLQDGQGGVGGIGQGSFSTTFINDRTEFLNDAGAGGAPDSTIFGLGDYLPGGGGGGWGGGAAGFFQGQARASAGAGGGSFAAEQVVFDENAPTEPVAGPAGGAGAVHIVILADGGEVLPPCVPESIGGTPYLRCVLSDTADVVDLAELTGSSRDSPIWIQAWGGKGADAGNGSLAPGGAPGFAQVVTTLGDYEDFYGTSQLYYALANPGIGNIGDVTTGITGSGGASTLVLAVPPSDQLDIDIDVVAIAGGGGSAASYCVDSGGIPGSPLDCTTAAGGDGGVALSNANQTRQAQPGESGGGAGNAGRGGAAGDGGLGGGDGIGGPSGGIVQSVGQFTTVSQPRSGWRNNSALLQTLTAGAGGQRGCATTGFVPPACMLGGGGGGYGGGASGFYAAPGQLRASGGGGGGTYAAPSTATDPNAPTRYVDGPPNGGAVHVVVKFPSFEDTFCTRGATTGSQTGTQCIIPFNYIFEIPDAFINDTDVVLLQAQGGRGGNGGTPGQAQTYRTAKSLADTTFYAWVGENGAAATTHGGGGGGATFLMTSADLNTPPDPFTAFSSPPFISPTDDFVLLAGGSGGGIAVGPCIAISDGGGIGGRGGQAISESDQIAYGSGQQGFPTLVTIGDDQSRPGAFGGSFTPPTNGFGWTANGGFRGELEIPSTTEPGVSTFPAMGSDGPDVLTFFGGAGGGAGPTAGTRTSVFLNSTPGAGASPPGGGGGTGPCQGGGGGAGVPGGGGAGGATVDGDTPLESLIPGGGGGGGGSAAAASNVDPAQIPSDWVGKWLNPPVDRSQGFVSLFFFDPSQVAAPVPTDGATITDTQPTLGYDGDGQPLADPPYVYRLTETGATATASITSQQTDLEIWTLATDGLIEPGKNYTWDVADTDGTSIQAPRTFTVDPGAARGTAGVNFAIRSMNWFATPPARQVFVPPLDPFPDDLTPNVAQTVPQATITQPIPPTPGECEPGPTNPGRFCGFYSATLDNPDNYNTYFTTQTPEQITTNPGALNVDWAVFDPSGKGLSELFTVRASGTLTVPASGNYTFAVNAGGGARFTLFDEANVAVGANPMVDTWGQIDGTCSTAYGPIFPPNQNQYVQEVLISAQYDCFNTRGVSSGQPVQLTAGTIYTFEMDGFISWIPGPFQLLYTSDLFANELTPVPGQWMTTNVDVGAVLPPSAPPRGIDDVEAVQRSLPQPTAPARDLSALTPPVTTDVDQFGPLGADLVTGSATTTIGAGPTQLAYRSPGGTNLPPPPAQANLPDGWTLDGAPTTLLFGDPAGTTCNGTSPPVDGSDVYRVAPGLLCGWTTNQGDTTNIWYVTVAPDTYQLGAVVEPDGSTWQLSWTTDGTTARLTKLQTPAGSAAQTDTSTTESATTWHLNYHPTGDVASLVAPTNSPTETGPGLGAALVYDYTTDLTGLPVTTITTGTLAEPSDPTTVIPGTLIETYHYRPSVA